MEGHVFEYLKGIPHIEGVAENLKRNQEYLQELVNKFLADKTNSLEERWEVWTKYSNKKDEAFIHHFKGFTKFEDYIHDDFVQKYQTVDYEDIMDMFEDYLNEYEEYNEETITLEINRMKEYLMDKNLGSYKFDW